jgi:AraC-like DNA-binding protein
VERSDQQQSRARFDKTASSWRRKLEGVQNKPMTGEWSQYYRQAALHDLEVLHARFIEHRFARHSHEYYVIGVVEAGVQAYSYRGVRHLTPAGHVFLVNPGEPHTGEAATPGGYIYRTVYPRLALMVDVTAETTVRAAPPFFTHAVIRDQSLSARLLRFHRAIAEGAPNMSVEWHLIDALAHLIGRYADDRRSRSRGLSERSAVRRAREYIDAHYDADVSLSELAAIVHLSPIYFARAFQKEVGLPPHAYLETVRITHGRELLLRGVPIADVSAAIGYGDQSHFTHRFKRVLGMTPGQVARSREMAGSQSAGSLPG